MAEDAERSRRTTSLGVRSQAWIAGTTRRDRGGSREFHQESLPQKAQLRSNYAHSGIFK